MKKIMIDILKSRKWTIAIMLALLAMRTYLLTCPPKIIGKIIDLLYDLEGNSNIILNYTYYLIGVCIVFLFVRISFKYIEVILSREPEKKLIIKLFQRFLRLKMKDIQDIKNGELMAYFVRDINEIRSAIYRIVSHGGRILFTFIIVAVQMINGTNLKLTTAVMIPIVIGGIISVKIKKCIEQSFKKAQAEFTEMSEYIQESSDSIRTTKAYSCEGKWLKDFIRKNTKVRGCNNTVDMYSNLLKMNLNICFGLCYGIALLYGSKLAIDGIITVGELVTFNGYIALFVAPIDWIPGIVSRTKRAQVSYARLDKIFELETEKVNEKDNVNNKQLDGNLEIKNLNFRYPSTEEYVLKNINLMIEKGKTYRNNWNGWKRQNYSYELNYKVI